MVGTLLQVGKKEGEILACIHSFGPQTRAGLITYLGTSRQNIHLSVTRLLEKGLIAVVPATARQKRLFRERNPRGAVPETILTLVAGKYPEYYSVVGVRPAE